MLNFIKQFLLNAKQTGAIAKSSEELADLITDSVNLKNAKVIVELGPGTGIFTKKILEKKSKKSIFFALETNPFFASETKNNCSDAIVYRDSAICIQKYLFKHKVKACDCIISGLPWAAFGNNLQQELINSIFSSLRNGGEFATFAYIQGPLLSAGKRFKNMLEEDFSQVAKTRIVWKNIPPAFVYQCKK